MPANWRSVGQDQYEELVGGTRVQRGTEWHVVTLPSNVYFQYRNPVPNETVPMADPIVGFYAGVIEQMMANPDVAGIVYVQDVNAAGQLVDVIEVTVALPGTDFTGLVSGPILWLNPPEFGISVHPYLPDLVAAEVVRLQGVATA